MRKSFGYGLAVLGVVGFLAISQQDYEEALSHENNYCHMVKNGAWPDYDGIYKTACTKDGESRRWRAERDGQPAP